MKIPVAACFYSPSGTSSGGASGNLPGPKASAKSDVVDVADVADVADVPKLSQNVLNAFLNILATHQPPTQKHLPGPFPGVLLGTCRDASVETIQQHNKSNA